jgi:hypothetical protein
MYITLFIMLRQQLSKIPPLQNCQKKVYHYHNYQNSLNY